MVDYFKIGLENQLKGNFLEAVNNYNNALAIDHLNYECYHHLGLIAFHFNKYDQAILLINKSIEINNTRSEIYLNLSSIYQKINNLDKAIENLNICLSIDPKFSEGYLNLGVLNLNIGKIDESIINLNKAINLKSDIYQAYYNLGNAYKFKNKFNTALNFYNKAIEYKNDYIEAYLNRGIIYQELQQTQEAIDDYTYIIKINPSYLPAYNNLIFLLNIEDNYKSLELARNFNNICIQLRKFKFTSWKLKDKLRIGFISGDFCKHPVSYFLESFLKYFKYPTIEIIAYSNTNIVDNTTRRLINYFDIWNNISDLKDDEAATLIHDQGINILFDLSGHTAKNRLPIFSYKPAPIQITWLGYSATTGLEDMDYILCDNYHYTKENFQFFIEKPLIMKDTANCFYVEKSDINIKIDLNFPFQKNNYLTFGCFNKYYKLNDKVINLWAKLLKELPDSKLFLCSNSFSEKVIQDKIIDKFNLRGIHSSRIILKDWNHSRDEHLFMHNEIDIALDPFPYSGGTTSIEALWMGVPLLTLKSDKFMARNGLTYNMNLGLVDWIAEDEEDFINIAKHFNINRKLLKDLKINLRSNLTKSKLINGNNFSMRFKTLMINLWDIYKSNYLK
jgi:protein O-GlcNAc transferase